MQHKYTYMRPCLVVLAVVLALAAVTSPAHADHDVLDFEGLTVVYIDLGTKGDSTLVAFPSGSAMLIDGGMPAAYENVRDTILEFGITKIDAVVATHPDQDHVAGLNFLLEDPTFEIGQAYAGPTSKDTKTYQTFLGLADEQILHAGDEIELDPAVKVSVLGPPDTLIQDGKNASLENSNSVILLIEYGDIEFLFTADTTYTTEAWLIQNHDDLDIDIMNVPHHGSRHGSTVQFIAATTPELVIYSANTDNTYGHPHPDAVSRYDASGAWQAKTSDGNVVVQTDGYKCSLVQAGTEYPCWADVMVVPEFPITYVVMLAGMAVAVSAGLGFKLNLGRM